jgi:hypothetical protein
MGPTHHPLFLLPPSCEQGTNDTNKAARHTEVDPFGGGRQSLLAVDGQGPLPSMAEEAAGCPAVRSMVHLQVRSMALPRAAGRRSQWREADNRGRRRRQGPHAVRVIKGRCRKALEGSGSERDPPETEELPKLVSTRASRTDLAPLSSGRGPSPPRRCDYDKS